MSSDASTARISFSPAIFGVAMAPMVVLAPVVTGVLFAQFGPISLLTVVLLAICTAPYWLPLAMARRNRRIEVSGAEVAVYNWRGRKTASVPLEDLHAVRVTTAPYIAFRDRLASPPQHLELVAEDAVWRAKTTLWDVAAITPFAESAGVPLLGDTPTSGSLVPLLEPPSSPLAPSGYALLVVCTLVLWAGASALGTGAFALLRATTDDAALRRVLAGVYLLVGLGVLLGFFRSALYRRWFRPGFTAMPPAVGYGAMYILLLGLFCALFLVPAVL